MTSIQQQRPARQGARAGAHGGRWRGALSIAGMLVLTTLAACGGGGDALSTASVGSADFAIAGDTATGATATASVGRATTQSVTTIAGGADSPTTTLDAARLAQQASFGATNALISEIAARGPAKWLAQQMVVGISSHPAMGSSAIDRWTSTTQDWCQGNFAAGTLGFAFCWRDYMTATPIAWSFYKQALTGKDQLRQRVALALTDLMPVSDMEVPGSYGLRDWHQMFRDRAFGNYRDLLREVIFSPVMGEFLNNVNNGKTDPNENFARELLQLFTIGTCQLNHDGSLKGGACQATYDNAMVREYAYALSGWTYPAGGSNAGCWTVCDGWKNPRYLSGKMVSVPAQHDSAAHTLLSGVSLPAGSSPERAVERVLDSVMNHPNMGPFIARRLIQQFVTSNPSAAYVDAVATAFETGTYAGFGYSGRGDLYATIAAVLLHPEARDPAYITKPGYGRLREPVQTWTAVMRALDARSDGIWWNWAFGDDMHQRPLSPPSVFSFYASDTPLAGTGLVAPAFGIEDEVSSLARNDLFQYASLGTADGVLQPVAPGVTGSTGTLVSHDRWLPSVADSAALVDQFDLLLTSGQLTTAQKTPIVAALDAIDSSSYGTAWQARRVRVAAYLVMMTPQFSIVR